MEELRKDDMMRHLLQALEAGDDIGHYGRLVFVMVARHFVDDDTIVQLLCNEKGVDEPQARALLKQVAERDYNPPRREKILEYQQQQDFPIIPDPQDPDAGNVYRNLHFPERVYSHIEEYREAQAEAEHH